MNSEYFITALFLFELQIILRMIILPKTHKIEKNKILRIIMDPRKLT